MGASAALLISTAVSVQQSKKAQEKQEKAADAQAAQATAKAKRSRIQSIREARIRSADIQAQSQATGAAESSAEIGATGSIQSQLASNIGHQGAIQDLSKQTSDALASAAKFQGNAAIARQFGSTAQSFIGVDFGKMKKPNTGTNQGTV
jgi:hypothetical protein